MLSDQIENQILRRMGQRARWIGLDRDARLFHKIRRAKPSGNLALVVTAGHGVEETAARLENIRRRREAVARQQSRGHAVLSRTSGMKRLGHCAKVFTQA